MALVCYLVGAMNAFQPIAEIFQISENVHHADVISVASGVAHGVHNARNVGVHSGEDVSVAHWSVLSCALSYIYRVPNQIILVKRKSCQSGNYFEGVFWAAMFHVKHDAFRVTSIGYSNCASGAWVG